MHRIVESSVLPAVDIQLVVVVVRTDTEPVQVLVDTVELVVDTAMSADIVEDRELDMHAWVMAL